jgi:hypothetical protein
MLEQLLAFFKFLFDLFNSLPQENKDKVKEAVVRAFEELFGTFFDAAGGTT